MTVLEEIREALEKRKEKSTAFKARVLVFGPGDSEGKRKRKNLVARLRRDGFEAYTSESLSKKVRSPLSAYQQEDEHWRIFDIILAFDFSVGVSSELHAYAITKTFWIKRS